MIATRELLAVAASLALVLATPDAHADTNEDCATAYAQTQILRKQGKLLDARKQAEACSADACKAYEIKDCKQWSTEISEEAPRVSFEGASPGVMARVLTRDDKEVAVLLDTKAVALDPGEYWVQFEKAGVDAPVRQRLTLKAGEGMSTLQAPEWPKPPPPPPPKSKPTPPQPLQTGEGMSASQAPERPKPPPPLPPKTQIIPPQPALPARLGGRRIGGIVLGSIGLAGLGAGVGLGVETLRMSGVLSSYETLATSCTEPHKSLPCISVYNSGGASLADSARSSQTATWVTLGIGAALATAGVVLFVTAPSTGTVRAGLVVTPGGTFVRGQW